MVYLNRPAVLGVILVVVAVAALNLGLRAFGQTEPKPLAPTKEVRAQRFVLVDEKDQTQASLMRGDDGRPALVLWNGDGTASATVEIDQGGKPRITLSNGDADVSMGFMDPGSPVFVMRDAKGKRRVVVVAGRERRTLINLYDDEQRERLSVGLTEKGQPIASAKDEEGNLRATFVQDETGVGLDLTAENGRGSISLNVDPKGQCDIGIVHGEGEMGVVMQADAEGRGNVMIFADKKPVWQAMKR